jgi:hypothetical protein
MAKMVEYTVAREHQGDRITDDGIVVHRYMEGDTRLANPTVVAALVKSGVLVAPDGEQPEDEAQEAAVPAQTEAPKPSEKAAPALANKAEPKPANKAVSGLRTKDK